MTGPKRVTDKQLAANRRNAQRSTGPRTTEGRSVSRWNALKHGVLAQAVIPAPLEPWEPRAEFEALLETLRDELQPGAALEEMLVERIATSYWRLSRLLRAEAGEIALRLLDCQSDVASGALLRELSQADISSIAARRGLSVERSPEGDEPRRMEAEYAVRSIPAPQDALLLSRYETRLERQIYRALTALERLQRLRAGEFVPPPLHVNVSDSDDDA